MGNVHQILKTRLKYTTTQNIHLYVSGCWYQKLQLQPLSCLWEQKLKADANSSYMIKLLIHTT